MKAGAPPQVSEGETVIKNSCSGWKIMMNFVLLNMNIGLVFTGACDVCREVEDFNHREFLRNSW